MRRAELLDKLDGEHPEFSSEGGGATEWPAPEEPSSAEPTKIDRPALDSGVTSEGAPPERAVGGPVRSPSLRQLLELDPAEKFDLVRLNGLSFAGVVGEAASDPAVLETLKEKAERLMVRVKSEEDDALRAGAFLREQVLDWYRRSPDDREWPSQAAPRWAGLFADSRATGGKLHPWLNARLRALYEQSLQAGRLGSRIRRGIRPSRSVGEAVTRTPLQQIQGEASQAILDDLADHPRRGEGPFPLVRLSELAVRRQVQTVNDALAALFNSPEMGPFIVLHPNRYPDCEEVQIRPPVGTASGAALAFVLVLHPVSRSAAGRASAKGRRGGAADDGAAPGTGESGLEYDGTTIWEAVEVARGDWLSVFDAYRRERKRLESPPKDFRGRSAFDTLREGLLADATFRKSFLACRWRGRPAGLPLLVNLLQKGSLVPEVATDHEYLEAELGALVSDDPNWRPPDASWKLPGWTVRRDADSSGVRYVAEPAEAPAK